MQTFLLYCCAELIVQGVVRKDLTTSVACRDKSLQRHDGAPAAVCPPALWSPPAALAAQRIDAWCSRAASRHLARRAPLEALLPTHVRNLLGTTPPPEKVFANRELRMADVKAIGFDYDYTLASYTNALNAFIYDRAKEHLMERSHYPAIDTSYDPSFAIRGLLFDRRTATWSSCRTRAVAQDAAFLGRRRLTTEELHRAYGPALHCDPHRVADDMSQFNDLFALSEVCLLADVVQLAVDRGIAFDAPALAEDVARARSSRAHIGRAARRRPRGPGHVPPSDRGLRISSWRRSARRERSSSS